MGMSIMGFFGWGKEEKKSTSAEIAAGRLKILIGTDRVLRQHLTKERIDQMHQEILIVINKYISGVALEDLQINHHKQNDVDVLEMSVTLPANVVEQPLVQVSA